jgi:hypothetical protein
VQRDEHPEDDAYRATHDGEHGRGE